MKNQTNFENNNLDLLRLLLALVVVLVHSSELSQLSSLAFFRNTQASNFAIKGFFTISGMLIYRSYSRSSSIKSYFNKRIRRIYPAYLVVILLSCLLLAAFSSERLSQYFGLGFWKFVFSNLVFLNFLAPSLPGVFTSNPFTTAVNGALWTLKLEVAFYFCVPILHTLSRRFGALKVIGTAAALSLTFQYLCEGMVASGHSVALWSKMLEQLPAQLLYFCAGIFLHLYFADLRQRLGVVSLGTLSVFLVDHYFLNGRVDFIWIAGIVMIAGFSFYLGNFSKYGDFSYGIYIVHFPIIQCAVALGLPSLSTPLFLSVSYFVCAVTTVALWNLVEKPWLGRQSHYIEKLAS